MVVRTEPWLSANFPGGVGDGEVEPSRAGAAAGESLADQERGASSCSDPPHQGGWRGVRDDRAGAGAAGALRALGWRARDRPAAAGGDLDRLGEVMLSDTVRFQVASTASDDLSSIEVAGARRPLRWPA